MDATATHPRRRFSVADYYRMVDTGILRPEDRVELIEGEIVEMPPIGPAHASGVDRLNKVLSTRVGDRAMVGVQRPVRLSRRSEPLPDLVLLRPRRDFYASTHPEPEDVLLLVEVADTSASYDRTVKAQLYANARIAEYWIVDLPRRLVEVCRAPAGDEYRLRDETGPEGWLSPAGVPDIRFQAREIFGD